MTHDVDAFGRPSAEIEQRIRRGLRAVAQMLEVDMEGTPEGQFWAVVEDSMDQSTRELWESISRAEQVEILHDMSGGTYVDYTSGPGLEGDRL